MVGSVRGDDEEGEGAAGSEEGWRVETALSRRKQDEGAPFRVQTAPRAAKQPSKLNNPHPLKIVPLPFRVGARLPSV